MSTQVRLVFRPMEPEDLEPCVDLYRRIFEHYPWRESWTHSTARRRLEEIFGAPNRFAYGAWDGEELLAFCLGTVITRSDRNSAQISEFGVEPQFALGNELGIQLLEYTAARLAERGVKSIYSMLLTDHPAIAWFQKSGFHYSQHYALLVKRMESE